MTTIVVLVSVCAGTITAQHSQNPPQLAAQWTFEETENPRQIRNVSGGVGWDLEADPAVQRGRGIQGQAILLKGAHALAVRPAFGGSCLGAVSFAAWAKPNELSGFREIFRQECDDRLLFSFQEGGTILSLGLNINGYVECDGSIDPAVVLDGTWHHCAATFDGTWMKVYLDGREVGKLQRKGRVSIQGDVQAFLGSSGGTGEHFQGALDDVRIYESALSKEEIEVMYAAGADAQKHLLVEMEAQLRGIYVAGSSFAESLAGTRKNMVCQGEGVASELSAPAYAKLKARFPKETERFRAATGITALEYMITPDTGLNARVTGRLMELMLEYKPLTEAQWQEQTAEANASWDEAEKLQERFEALTARGEQANFSPEWIELVLQASERVQFRPFQNEPVAPYVKPETPVTRDLSSSEARELLERDWLHQATPSLDARRMREEITWARELADRLQTSYPGKVEFAKELETLAELERLAQQAPDDDRELYFKIREVKRRIVFRNPALDFRQILFVDMPFPQGSEWRHETRHRLGYMAVPGARLLVLDGMGPDGRLRQLMPQAPLHGSFWRPDVSFDGQKVLFCFKPHNEKAFHLYEINADGSDLRQLTRGNFDDFDPIYLPDDKHVVFSTTRAHTYVRCMPPTSSFVLARCERDGSNMYFISANNEPDYLPSLMHDGRIIYTRWEYTDKPLWRAEKLWTVNPDGTQVTMFWGNQSVWPDLTKDARAIPGSRKVMFTGSAHHDWFAGSVGIIDPDRGFNFPNGLTKVTADVPWPECGNGPTDPVESPDYHASGKYAAYYSPYPISERDFLVSAEREGKFVLYLMDVDGNRELVYEGAHHIFHAVPLKARVKPPVLPDHVAWPQLADRESPKEGVIFSSDVYQGAPEELRGKARFLRVFSIDNKTYTYWYKRPYISTGPVVSAVQSEGVKRLLGTVPIEADGSVSFKAPAGLTLHFQLLDEEQRALQTMRSFVNVMPGEYRGCLGCHESHSRTPVVGEMAEATHRLPHEITPPPWPDTTVSYPRYVQPVLDRYCGKCHQGEGEARKTLDLTERPSSPVFTEPYLTLIGRPSWGAPYQPPTDPPPGFGLAGCLLVEAYGTVDPHAYLTPKPMTSLSYRSRLIDLVSSGKHHDVKVDEISRLRLIAWVDAMCPYMGDDEIRQIPDPVFQGVDWLAVRPKVASAPIIARPGPVD